MKTGQVATLVTLAPQGPNRNQGPIVLGAAHTQSERQSLACRARNVTIQDRQRVGEQCCYPPFKGGKLRHREIKGQIFKRAQYGGS